MQGEHHLGDVMATGVSKGPSECNDGYRCRLVMEHCYLHKSQNCCLKMCFSLLKYTKVASNYNLFVFL